MYMYHVQHRIRDEIQILLLLLLLLYSSSGVVLIHVHVLRTPYLLRTYMD
jgi:hypothetical protein